MSGINECPHCGYRFEDPESLTRHMNDGCPEEKT